MYSTISGKFDYDGILLYTDTFIPTLYLMSKYSNSEIKLDAMSSARLKADKIKNIITAAESEYPLAIDDLCKNYAHYGLSRESASKWCDIRRKTGFPFIMMLEIEALRQWHARILKPNISKEKLTLHEHSQTHICIPNKKGTFNSIPACKNGYNGGKYW